MGSYRLDHFSYHIQTILRSDSSFTINPIPELVLQFDIQTYDGPLCSAQVKINGQTVGSRAGAVNVFVQMLAAEDPQLSFFTSKYIPMPRRNSDLPPKRPPEWSQTEEDNQLVNGMASLVEQRNAAEEQLDAILASLPHHLDMEHNVDARRFWEGHTARADERRAARSS